jgi:hypothetical protein
MQDVIGSCQKCAQHIAFDPAAAGSEVTCPHCNLITKLLTPAMVAGQQQAQQAAQQHAARAKARAQQAQQVKQAVAGVAQSAGSAITKFVAGTSAPVSTGEHPSEYLSRVRRSTCYPVVRIVLRLFAGMMFLLAVLSLLSLPIGFFALPEDVELPTSAIIGIILSGISSAIGFVVIGTFFFQASSVVIDIADILADANRRKTP